jgi:Ran-binding protein 1
MFGGGAKKEKKEDEDRGDTSGSAKAQRDAAADVRYSSRPQR